MSHDNSATSRFDPVEVDLKNPAWAALLAWLWPGAGHLYQRRYGKALLFMVCILVTYFWGLAMGEGHVVYASLRKHDMRYPYLLQVGVGLPAMPAMVQAYLAQDGGTLFGSSFMAPPDQPIDEQTHDEKATWHEQLGFYFELGTLFTMVAGLLNLLVVYDAYAGPAFALPESQALRRASDAKEKSKSGLAGTIEFVGIVCGVVLAMTLRAKWQIDRQAVSYLMAIAGGVAGAVGGRIVYRLLSAVPNLAGSNSGRSSTSSDDVG